MQSNLLRLQEVQSLCMQCNHIVCFSEVETAIQEGPQPPSSESFVRQSNHRSVIKVLAICYGPIHCRYHSLLEVTVYSVLLSQSLTGISNGTIRLLTRNAYDHQSSKRMRFPCLGVCVSTRHLRGSSNDKV